MPLTDTGYVMPTIEEIKSDLEEDFRAEIDPAIDLSPEQPMGQAVGIFARTEALTQELIQTLANGMNPNAAENFLLDNICALTGTTREPAKKSTVTLSCDLDAAFTAAQGSMMANVVGFEGIRFVNVEEVDLSLEVAGVYPIEFESSEYGPVVANATTLTVITAPVTGWNSCTNALDAVLGSHVETDELLRKRREDELTAAGACTVDSIRADILKVDGVKQCYVFENVSLSTDENGLPGKSIEVVIHDGIVPAADDDEIAQAVWDSKPAGSETYGTTTVMVADSTGIPRAVKFSRATVKNVWFEFDVLIDSTFYPTAGASLIKVAAALYGDNYLNLGRDVFANTFKAAALAIPGVLDVTALRLGFSASPVGLVNLTITGREIADVDTSRMTVTATAGAP